MILLSLLLLTQTVIAGPQNVEFETRSINNTEELIREKVNFINPIDAFTMYAFMNYTGYDAENHTGYHPVREGVRNDLAKMDINISRPNYFSESGWSMLEGDMPSFIGWLGNPPNFKIETKMKKAIGMYVPDYLYDLDEMLTEFYGQVDIKDLYEKYNPYYEDVIEQNQDQVYDELARLYA